ncbi:hypothetical protein A8W25_07815 [Streptomyces sp. ERV7]|nr:hypothetical protein A8W25_07815 [Streptomyces sp. ERV7]
MPRTRSLVLAAGAALLVRRAVRRRIAASPLWPMPALETPISGQGGRRAPSGTCTWGCAARVASAGTRRWAR